MPRNNKNKKSVNFKESVKENNPKKNKKFSKNSKSAVEAEPISNSTSSAKTKHMAKTSRPISIYKKIAVSFIVLTLLLVAAVVYFSVVSVKIVIIPNKERTAASFMATIKDKESGQEVSGNIIGGAIETVPLEAEGTFSSTGREVEGVEVTGTVTIFNTSSREQPLIKTTRLLSSDNKLFRLKDTVRVPARGQLDNVKIYADEPSSEMEIGPTKFTIPGLNTASQKLIYAESKEVTVYSETGDLLISAEDLQQARDNLRDQLSAKIDKLINVKKYKGFDKIVADFNAEAIEFSTDKKAGEKAENFFMTAKVDAALVAFNIEDIAELAKMKISENLPDDKDLASFDSDNFEFAVDRYDLEAKTADLKVEASAQMILKGGTEIIKPEKLVGLTREQLDDYLSSLREVAGYEIRFTPGWITKVPALVDHVKVEVVK